jgi:hypothetical protein
MHTYIIFFGKSQDFTFNAFDRNGYIKDFNQVIKDFDLLESGYFTVDDPLNREILAKYNFRTKDGRSYSLLKLYSLAQAFNGSRIAGSIYGVAILSTNDILFSKENVQLLKNAKEYFAKKSMNGLKFNKSNFYEDVKSIWSLILNSGGVNYFDRISLNEAPLISENPNPRAYYVKSIYEDSLRLNNEMKLTQRIYISSDINHLKRANAKWGKQFPIYTFEDGVIQQYQESHIKTDTTILGEFKTNKDDNLNYSDFDKRLRVLKADVSDLKYENERLKKEHSRVVSDLKKQLTLYKNILIISSILFFLLVFSLLIKNGKKEASPNSGKVDSIKHELGNNDSLTTEISSIEKDKAVLLAIAQLYLIKKNSSTNENILTIRVNRDSLRAEVFSKIKILGYDSLKIENYLLGMD